MGEVGVEWLTEAVECCEFSGDWHVSHHGLEMSQRRRHFHFDRFPARLVS